MGKVRRLTVFDVPWITKPTGDVIIITPMPVMGKNSIAVGAHLHLPASAWHSPEWEAWQKRQEQIIKTDEIRVLGYIPFSPGAPFPYQEIDNFVQDAFEGQPVQGYAILHDPADEPNIAG